MFAEVKVLDNRIHDLDSGIKVGDYRPLLDRQNYEAGFMNQEAVVKSTADFIKEYVTKLTTNEYSYIYGTDGKFTAPGWDGAMEDSYRKAITYGCDDNPKLQAMRVAEYNSFLQIQEALKDKPGAKAILQSPNRGWGYNYISTYTNNLQPNGEQIIDVKIHRIWDKDRAQDKSHAEVRDEWMREPCINARMISQEGALRPEVEAILQSEAVSHEARAAFAQEQEINTILNHALIIDNPAFATDSELLARYYEQDGAFFDFTFQDKLIQAQIEEFHPEIERFTDVLLNTQLTSENDYRIIENSFKQLLVKAKVFFDEEAAYQMWGDQPGVIRQIKDSIRTLTKQLNGENTLMSKDDEDDLLFRIRQLQIIIAGSCGKVSIGQSTMEQIMGAFTVNDGISRSLGDNTKFVHECGQHHLISASNGIQVDNCGFCGKPVIC